MRTGRALVVATLARAVTLPAVAAPMTMNRVIHAAVRRDLSRLEGALAGAADGDRTRARQLDAAYANLLRELTRHHTGEDEIVFPFVSRVDGAQELLAAMEDEHQALAAALAETRRAMSAYARSGAAVDARHAREAVVHAQTVVEQHLSHEEEEFEPLVRPLLGTPEWKAMEKQLRPSKLTDSGDFLAWIQDGMTDEGRAYLRTTIPPPITFLLTRVAGRSYRKQIAPVWAGA
jgi:hemerythrin-like domain-containing protein